MRGRAAFAAIGLGLGLGLWPGAAAALDLALPSSAVKTREIREDAATYFLPVGRFNGSDVPALRVEGALVQQAWRIDAPGLTTLQMLRPLRAQLDEAGYDILFSCPAQVCGGFDFRFETRVIPAPDMFVDLLDYHFVSARRDAASQDASYVSLLVSRTGSAGYIQVIRVMRGQTGAAPPESAPELAAPEENAAPDGAPDSALARRLMRDGRVVLVDLDFATGTVALGEGPYDSLRQLADFLNEDPDRRIALVGHTDSVGGLASNIALSRRRAQAVADRLVDTFDVSAQQLEAEGAGYLAPIASNLTEAGREANRRVEAVLLDTE